MLHLMVKPLLQNTGHKEGTFVVAAGLGKLAFLKELVAFIFQVLDQIQQHSLQNITTWLGRCGTSPVLQIRARG